MTERVRKLPRPDAANILAGHLRVAGFRNFRRELQFHPTRKWRFDVAWPAAKLAVEIHGGMYVRGRHTRPGGFQADCEKYRAAVLHGWRLLPFTTEELKRAPGKVVETIRRALEVSE